MSPRFKDAAASIRRTTTQYNYQLVIQRAYEEGEEQFSESDDGNLEDGTSSEPIQKRSFHLFCTKHASIESKDERVFLLDESLHFRSTFVGGSVILAWRDLSGDPGDVYKFICDSNTQPGVSHTFELVGKNFRSPGLLSDAHSNCVNSLSMYVGAKVSQVP
jgi:hypothetical protein